MSPKTEETLGSKSDPAGAEDKKDKEKAIKTEKEAEDLSEEDKKLKEELELCVTRLQESDDKVRTFKNICIYFTNISGDDKRT